MQKKLRRQVRRVVNEYFVGRKRFTMIILMMRLKIVGNISCWWINDRISLKPNKYSLNMYSIHVTSFFFLAFPARRASFSLYRLYALERVLSTVAVFVFF